jgi:hypothetical protein
MKIIPVMANIAPKKKIEIVPRRIEIKNPHLEDDNLNIADLGIAKYSPWQSRITLVYNHKCYNERNHKGHNVPAVWSVWVLSRG